MEKEGGYLFLKTLVFVVLILLANSLFFVYKSTGFTGFSVKSFKDIEENFSYLKNINPQTQTFLIGQWILLILLLLYAAVRDLTLIRGRRPSLEINYSAPVNFRTDMDTLYEILKKHKKVSVTDIAKSFSVEKDLVLEWFKILESGDLAEIYYPGFGDPVLKLKENEIETFETNLIPEKKEMENKKAEVEDKNAGAENKKAFDISFLFKKKDEKVNSMILKDEKVNSIPVKRNNKITLKSRKK